MDECQSANVLLEPAHEVLSDFSAVLIGDHLMAIAGQPDIFEVHVRGLYACLIALNVELIPRGMFNCQIFKPRGVGD